MINQNINALVEKTFNITSLFADIKSDHNWSAYEIKTVMLLFSELDNFTKYIPDMKSDSTNLETLFKDAPKKYSFKKSEFIFLTGIRKEHISREINKIRKSLISKSIHLPHPMKIDDYNSGISITWFNLIEYNNSTGELTLHVNPQALPRLLAFAKYANVSFGSIAKLKNSYSIFTYLSLKIIKDSSFQKSIKEFEITIDHFKDKVGVKNKYKMVRQFREFVLDVVKKEINEQTEIYLDYNLIKEGRSFNKIKFTFDYKPEYLAQKAKSKYNKSEQLNVIESTHADNYDSPFEHILTGWNIRARKVVELEETYSLDVIQAAIDLTLEKEAAGEIITTKAAIFLGILENKQLASDEQFEREQYVAREDQDKTLKKQLADEYDAIQKVIDDNADEISNYLSAKSINATYEINSELNEQLLNMSCVEAEKFKEFRPKLPILHNGYYDMKNKKEIRPNMYQFLIIISK